MKIPGEAVKAAEQALRQLRAVQAGWAFGVPEDGQPVWLSQAATAAVEAAAPHIYAELGHDHYVIFTEDRWTVEHSVECKLSGHMHECEYHAAIVQIASEFDPERLGRWRITGISEGLPDLERVDADSTATGT